MVTNGNVLNAGSRARLTRRDGAALAVAGLRFLFCAAALSSLTACEFMQYFGGEGAIATAVERPAPEPVEPTAEDIKSIQMRLADLGYRPGAADGEVGPGTVQAIETYQKQAGLPVDGEVSLALLDSLENNPVRAPRRPRAVEPSSPEKAEPADAAAEAEKDVVVIPIPRDLPQNTLPPLYEAGDQFVWSDGHVDTVYRVSGNRVFWRQSDGASFNNDLNFLIPPSSWDDISGPGSSTVDLHGESLWPLQPGGDVSFTVTASSSSNDSSEIVEHWRCSTDGEKVVSVPAGVFDTQVLACERDGAQPGVWTSRTWYYAPAVRHYVRRIDELADGSRRAISLVAMRPSGQNWPSAARVGFDWAIQDALEKQPNGVAVEWGSTGVKEKFRIMPTKNHDSIGESRCRSFVLMRGDSTAQRTYPAFACRDKSTERWLVPVLDAGSPTLDGLPGAS